MCAICNWWTNCDHSGTGHSGCTWFLTIGHIVVPLGETFKVHLFFNHWVHCGWALSVITVYSACAHWVYGSLSPVSFKVFFAISLAVQSQCPQPVRLKLSQNNTSKVFPGSTLGMSLKFHPQWIIFGKFWENFGKMSDTFKIFWVFQFPWHFLAVFPKFPWNFPKAVHHGWGFKEIPNMPTVRMTPTHGNQYPATCSCLMVAALPGACEKNFKVGVGVQSKSEYARNVFWLGWDNPAFSLISLLSGNPQ